MILGRNKSTISREIRRNTDLRGYRPKQAQRLAEERHKFKVRPRFSDDSWLAVEQLLNLDWSPEQISLWLKSFCAVSIGQEWIYQYVLQEQAVGGDLHRHLRCQKQRRKRYGSYNRRGQLIDRVSIDERPAIVDRRSRSDDWGLNTIIGKNHQQAIVSSTERKSRYALIKKVERETAQCVSDAIVGLLSPFMSQVHTMTSDNGKEFADHKNIAGKLGADFYFAHPCASWERGLNENTNGLIRQYFPKGSDFTIITQEEIDQAMDKRNNRPRKYLGMKTPNQVFLGINPPVALAS